MLLLYQNNMKNRNYLPNAIAIREHNFMKNKYFFNVKVRFSKHHELYVSKMGMYNFRLLKYSFFKK